MVAGGQARGPRRRRHAARVATHESNVVVATGGRPVAGRWTLGDDRRDAHAHLRAPSSRLATGRGRGLIRATCRVSVHFCAVAWLSTYETSSSLCWYYRARRGVPGRSLPAAGRKNPGAAFFHRQWRLRRNAAVAIARLGGRAARAGPLGEDSNGDRVLAALAREEIDCSGCQRLAGVPTALSAIFIDARGDRMIVTHCDDRLAAATPANAGSLVAGANAVVAD